MATGFYGSTEQAIVDVTELVERAETAATNAETAEANAEIAETNAETAETNASTSETNAATSATNAGVSETNAGTSATTASDNAGYAQEWANTIEDTLVSAAAGGDQVDDYSALHHSAKAALEAGYASDWAITPEDTLVPVAAGGNGTTDYSSLHWAAKAAASGGGGGGLTPDYNQTGVIADGNKFMADSSVARTRALPAGTDGLHVGAKDDTGSAATNNVTIQPNGTDKIMGVNADLIISTNYGNVELIFRGSTSDWRIVDG